MTGTEAGMTSIGPAHSWLLRRLLIRCPVTGLATDTGFELSAVPYVGSARQCLVDCLECGQDHEWGIEDAVLDDLGALRTDGRAQR